MKKGKTLDRHDEEEEEEEEQTWVTKYNLSTWEKLQVYRIIMLVHSKLLLW